MWSENQRASKIELPGNTEALLKDEHKFIKALICRGVGFSPMWRGSCMISTEWGHAALA
jgi:hypothetical protein